MSMSLVKKKSQERKKNSKNISLVNSKLVHKIFDTINISLLILILIFSFLSFNSQRKWSSIYKILSTTKANNNNLIDYISKTEEFYISEIESLNNFKKTTPGDLIYVEKTKYNNKNIFTKKLTNIMNGFKDSKYQKGY